MLACGCSERSALTPLVGSFTSCWLLRLLSCSSESFKGVECCSGRISYSLLKQL